MESIDDRSYPRTELCPCCQVREVDVIGPGDTWSLCPECHLALMDEHTTTLSEAYRFEEERMRAEAKEPTATDAAYAERDRLISFLSRILPTHVAPATDAEPGWQDVVCVHGPTGQMSWHVPDDEIATLFRHLNRAPNDWDGHTTDEKYRRLDAIHKWDLT